jgi:hypothetical protein
METTLVIVTGLSLVVAGGMAALLVRMLRQERRRSDARVTLLEQLAAEPRSAIQPNVQRAPRVQPHAPVLGTVSHGQTTSRPPTPRARAPVSFDDLDLRTSHASTVVEQEIFHEHDAPSAWPRRLAVVGVLAAVLAAVFFGWSAVRFAPAVGPVDQATARALDFTRLSPGDESPFVIRLAVSKPVARYRVGFRGENDRVLDHVDRRNPDAVAQKQAP